MIIKKEGVSLGLARNASSRSRRPSSAPIGEPRGGAKSSLLTKSRGGGGRRFSRGGRKPNPKNNRPTDDEQPRPSSPRRESAPQGPREVTIPPAVTVRDLAELMGCSPIDLIKGLMEAGVMANINQQLDYDTAAIVAEDMGYTVLAEQAAEPEAEAEEESAAPVTMRRTEYDEEELDQLRERPPVVTILGHVDHGKTSLLDVIRQTNVQSGEVGGITQHIGAYQVTVHDRGITFLDTPGHAAFTAMRARGASVTDIAILVVAADDGVQPQTMEAINHARAARVPIIVALNKMDLDTANPDRVMQQLSEQGLVPEDWGGETICVPVSAKARDGIEGLLDMILLVADMAEFKANPRRTPEGTVIEGRLDRARGPIATLLVMEGTLSVGDALLVGNTHGKIRAMFDYQGKPIKKARPSTPVMVMGLRDVPEAGDTFKVVEDERTARDLAAARAMESQGKANRATRLMTLEDVYAQAQAGSVQSLNLILKADVQGSLEPIVDSLERLEMEGLNVRFVHQGVGNIAESDIMLAIASQAIVLGFSVSIDTAAERLAEVEGVEVRTYNIIYRLIEDVQLALSGMLEPTFKEVVQGQALVRQVFRVPRVGTIAGAQVSSGKALRNAKMRVKRAGEVLFEGEVASLKRFTEDVREVASGYECGIGVGSFKDLQEGDVIEFYTVEQEKPAA